MTTRRVIGTGWPDDLEAIAGEALGAYGLTPVVSVRPLRAVNNATFEVVTHAADRADRLVLRIHRPGYRTAEEIASELEILEAIQDPLRGRGIRVPVPLRTADEQLFTTVIGGSDVGEQQLVCDILTWVDGRVLKPGRGLGAAGARDIGHALGALHEALDEASGGQSFTRPALDLDGLASDKSKYGSGGLSKLRARLSPEDWQLVRHVISEAAETFMLLDQDGHDPGLVHGDFILLNCHLLSRRSGWNVGVIDFDDCGWGHQLLDVATMVENLSGFPSSRRLTGAFLDGYRDIHELPSVAEDRLPSLVGLRHVASCVWLELADQGALPHPVDKLVAVRLELMRESLELVL